MFEQQSFSGDTLGADIAGIAGGERTSAFPKCELSAANMSTKQPSIGGHAATLKDYGRPSIRRRGDSMMDRRVFVTLIAGTCLLEPFAVRAQQSGKVFRLDCSFRGPNRKVRTRSLWSLFGRVCAILAGWKARTS